VSNLTHLDDKGRARMVDVGEKPVTKRTAVASARIRIGKALRARIASDTMPKGDVFAVARIAGIMAAKKTAELIPLCHALPLDGVEVEVTLEKEGVALRATVSTSARTGVEMEALTAVSVAALAFYDMCKSMDPGMVVERVRLEQKHGGKSGVFTRRRKNGE
jgi:cyclic pyranopterin phosphate synthase